MNRRLFTVCCLIPTILVIIAHHAAAADGGKPITPAQVYARTQWLLSRVESQPNWLKTAKTR